MINKSFLTFFLGLLTLTLTACTVCTSKQQKPTPLVFSNWQLEKKVFKEENQEPFYLITAKYPEVVNQTKLASTQHLNELIRTYVSKSIEQFKRVIPKDSTELQDYPPEMRHNEFHITYSATLIKPQQHTIVSLRFETDMVLFAEPRHQHGFAVINYDLSQDKMLSLDSLFKPDSDYLPLLAKACQKQLTARLSAGMLWVPTNPEGSKPYPENFKIWNLEEKGLLITYQENQVSPYSAVPQTILIPYASLRPVLSETSPVTVYAYR